MFAADVLTKARWRGYHRRYSAEVWHAKYCNGYDVSGPVEDGRYGALLALIRRYDRGSILDAGCGDGTLEARYRALSASRLVGVDYAPAAIGAAAARGIAAAEFVCSDFRTFRTNECFSVVVLNESLYYVDDVLVTMTALERWLDVDGVFIVSMLDRRLSRRIWTRLRRRYTAAQALRISDEPTGLAWRIQVLRRR